MKKLLMAVVLGVPFVATADTLSVDMPKTLGELLPYCDGKATNMREGMFVGYCNGLVMGALIALDTVSTDESSDPGIFRICYDVEGPLPVREVAQFARKTKSLHKEAPEVGIFAAASMRFGCLKPRSK